MVIQQTIEKESAVTQGVRRTTGVTADQPHFSDPTKSSSGEVIARSTRRRLSVAYKLKVLETVAALKIQGHGAIGAYLRKEGLYYSSVLSWGRLQAQGLLTSNRQGPKEKSRAALVTENKKLRRKLEQTAKRLEKTELIVELQKKLSAILDLEIQSNAEKNAEQ